MTQAPINAAHLSHEFSGHIYIFQSFDVADIIDLELVKRDNLLEQKTLQLSKYFKNYHIPLEVALPKMHATHHCDSVKLHQFGAITLKYKVPFTSTFQNLRTKINEIEDQYEEQSDRDATIIFEKIASALKKPNFYHLKKSYLLIQIDSTGPLSSKEFLEHYGDMIASTLRFETENLSEYKKNEILHNAFGYYRGDLIIIDVEAAFIYDEEYEELLDLFEFVNLQHLELQYYDKLLDDKLSAAYKEAHPLTLFAYLPLWGTIGVNRVGELGNLKVDISVITERLENSIKLTGEPYYTELYEALTQTLGLQMWKESLDKKLSIIHDISDVFENKIRTVREDLFNILIALLIFVECSFAIMSYLNR